MEEEKFRFNEESVEVRDLDTGKLVNRPDIARKGMDIIGSAMNAAGVEIVVPDDISSLLKLEDEPPKED